MPSITLPDPVYQYLIKQMRQLRPSMQQMLFPHAQDLRLTRIADPTQHDRQPVDNDRVDVEQGSEMEQDHKGPQDLDVRPLLFGPRVSLVFGAVQEALVPDHGGKYTQHIL
ncbi:hypothetical protein B0A50_08330 [Salinomyces thailandicus]|uniref:Uncharacterized protein n=1 Tax=Salinomyces thailandicus TaxID=706561 RepID=A0A4U0TK22_9PEZI|nr:hypothetical protein B0A50_08330 [Salinomyces thailandica]